MGEENSGEYMTPERCYQLGCQRCLVSILEGTQILTDGRSMLGLSSILKEFQFV